VIKEKDRAIRGVTLALFVGVPCIAALRRGKNLPRHRGDRQNFEDGI
jgi:hypothetical protein